MPNSTRVIRRRIKSVTSTRKITQAMEMVSASKMRRAVNSVLATRPYAMLAWETLTELSQGKNTETLHPLMLKNAEVIKILLILITSDRGLCGGFNAAMLKKTINFLQHPKNKEVEIVTKEKKGQDAMRRLKLPLVAAFTNLSNHPTISDARPIAKMAFDDFSAKKYRKVYLAYNDFRSSISQIPTVKQLLPLEKSEELGEITSPPAYAKASAGRQPSPAHKTLSLDGRGQGEGGSHFCDYLFEPSPRIVLETMVPHLTEMQIYQAILESSASEHSARMVAMKNASDSAKDMIDDLVFTFNQARQSAITREIAEICSGKTVIE